MRPGYPTVEKVRSCEDVEQLLRWYRTLPFAEDDDESKLIDVLDARLGEVRSRDNAAYVAASKRIGHGEDLIP